MSDYFSTNALMPDGQLKIIGLEDYLGQFVVILFYQGDFTPFATSELLAFAGENEKFAENGCQVKQNPIRNWRLKTRLQTSPINCPSIIMSLNFYILCD